MLSIQAVAVIVRSAAGGHITAAEASSFCDLLEAQRKAIEMSELDLRLRALEEATPS